MHRVTGGESLNMYADKYFTTVDVIEAINYDLTLPIHDGGVLAIAPGLKQISVLPPFETYEVSAPTVSLESVAAKLSVAREALLQYNDFAADCRMLSGWVLIPHPRTATP